MAQSKHYSKNPDTLILGVYFKHGSKSLPSQSFSPDEQSLALLDDWRDRCRQSQHKHYGSAEKFGLYGRLLTVPTTVISAMVAAGLAIAIDHTPSSTWKLVGAILSGIAALLTALESTLEFTKRAERHKSAGARFAGLRREIESLIAQPPHDAADYRVALAVIRERMNCLAELSPALPPNLWKQQLPSKSVPT